jgi:PAS domain S-box-containing protein
MDDATTRRLELLRVLQEEAREYGIFLLDPDGRVTSWNVGAERLLGYPAGDILGRHVSAFYRPEDVVRGSPERDIARATAEARVVSEGWRVRQDDSLFWARVVLTSIRDAHGELVGFSNLTRELVWPHRTPPDPAPAGTERALRESEERLRLLVDGVSEYAMFMLDPDGHVTSWNPGAERIKGYKAREILGQHFSRFYVPDDVAAGRPQRLLAEATANGKTEDEAWRVRKDGSLFWANVVLTALRDEAGRLLGFAKVTRDLTDRREADARERELYRAQVARDAAEAAAENLRRSEQRYRAASERLGIVLEGVSDGISMQDASGRVVYANGQAARSCGYASPAEMLAAPPSDLVERFALFDKDDSPLSHEELPNRRVLAGEERSERLVHVRDRRSNRDWWSFVQARAVHDADGRLEAVVSIWHDATSHQRREEELELLADAGVLLSSTLDHEVTLRKLAELIVPRLADWCSIDLVEGDALRSLVVAHSDPAKVQMARLLRERYPPALSAETGATQVVRTGRSELYAEITDELLVRGAQDAEHLRIARELGLQSAMIVPIARPGEPALGAITFVSAESGRRYDRADLALAEELARRAALAFDNARLYRAARDAISLRDEFLSVAGHELKTPLAAMLLQLQSLARLAERGDLASNDERARNRLRKTVALGSRLDRLVRELLDVSRITSGRLTLQRDDCDLVALVREVAGRLEDEAVLAGCHMLLRLDGQVVGCWDGARLDQVATNLISNAIKYGRGKPIEAAVEVIGGKARLTVRDHGIGIPPEHQARIFGRFERAVSDHNYGGIGLGLWIVRQIVDGHGGQVHLQSTVGEGSTFVVELPDVVHVSP